MTDSSGIELHAFQHKLCDTLVDYQVTKMTGQTMIWVGTGDAKLSNLSAAVPVQVRQYTCTVHKTGFAGLPQYSHHWQAGAGQQPLQQTGQET